MREEIRQLEEALAEARKAGDRGLVNDIRREIAVTNGQAFVHVKSVDEVLEEKRRFSYGGGDS